MNQLLRDRRKIALADCTSLDLRSSQFAVVAKLWEGSLLEEFLCRNLRGGQSIGTALYEHLGVGPEAKPILKTQVYALAYGRGLGWVVHRLAKGEKGNPGIGFENARRFPEHPLIAALLEARVDAYRRIEDEEGGKDAFGVWIAKEGRASRSIAAQQAQSYELRVMMAILPVLHREEDIRVLSWLHDGVSVKIGDSKEKAP